MSYHLAKIIRKISSSHLNKINVLDFSKAIARTTVGYVIIITFLYSISFLETS